MARTVGGCTSALHGWTFTKLGGVATEGALVNLALLGARERYTVVLQLINCLGRLAGQIFHCIGVTQPIRALDRIIHMPLPAVWSHVTQAGSNAALRRDGVRASWKHFGHAGGA